MTSFAAFRLLDSDFDIDANEVINLRRNASNTFWSGSVTDDQNQLSVMFVDQPTAGLYEMQLTLLHVGVPIASSTWLHVQPPATDRWDTRTKTDVAVPGQQFSSLHILG